MEETAPAGSVEQTREIEPLTMRAAFRPGSVNVEERTAELIWTTGARVKRGFWEPYWEELSLDPKNVRLDRLNNGAPLLAAHNAYDLDGVLGVVEGATLQKNKGVATVRFAKAEDNPEADKAFRMVKDGILQNVSVGYRVYKLEQIEDGRARDDKTPVLLATDWEPFELSVVPMGADDGAGFRSTDRTPNRCTLVTRENVMADPVKPTPTPAAPAADPVDELVATARRQNAETQAATAAEAARAAEQAAAAERERIAEINKLVRMTKLGEELAERLVRSGASIDKVREIVLREVALASEKDPINGHVRYEAGDDKSEKFIRGACAGIFSRAGLIPVIAQAKELKAFAHHLRDVELDPGEFRGMKLIDMARASLEMRGISTRGLYGEALVKRALTFRGDAGMNTKSDFAILLETAVAKTFLGQYATTPVSWRRWCGVKSLQDFRTASFYRPGSFGKLDKVTEGGEIKHKNIPDGEKATLAAATVGNIIGITRKAIVDDDLGVFRDLAAQLGQAAAYSVEADAYALITANAGLGPTQTDGQPLFHANRSNIGAGGAMSVTTWDGAAAVMASQKDVSKNMILDLSPAVWLGPRTMLLAARTLNENGTDPTSNKNGVTNPVRGMVRDLVGTAQLPGSGGTTTRHYFLADPGLYPVFAVGFIDGQEAPRIDSEQSFEYDGVQWRVILDYGTGVLDFRGAVASPGV